MHNKRHNNKSSYFIQGLRPFSKTIPQNLKRAIKRGSYNFSYILDNWTKIVGKKIADNSYPIKIKMKKGLENGTLILNVLHGKELEVEYSKNEIIDKINVFFGYNFINQVQSKIIREKKEIHKKITLVKSKGRLEKKIKNIQNKNLQNSLKNLLEAYELEK